MGKTITVSRMCEVTLGSFFVFFLVSGVKGRTPPALFVLLFVWTNQRSLWRARACVRVLCAQVGIQGEQVTPLFVLWLTIKRGPLAHRSQYPPSATLPWWRAASSARNKSSSSHRHLQAIFPCFSSPCVFTSTSVHHPARLHLSRFKFSAWTGLDHWEGPKFRFWSAAGGFSPEWRKTCCLNALTWWTRGFTWQADRQTAWRQEVNLISLRSLVEYLLWKWARCLNFRLKSVVAACLVNKGKIIISFEQVSILYNGLTSEVKNAARWILIVTFLPIEGQTGEKNCQNVKSCLELIDYSRLRSNCCRTVEDSTLGL